MWCPGIGHELLVRVQCLLERRDLIRRNAWVSAAIDGQDRDPDLTRELQRRQPAGWCLRKTIEANHADQPAHPSRGHVGEATTQTESPGGNPRGAARVEIID